MSYLEIIEALKQGKTVFWENVSYKVFLQNGVLYEINLINDSMCKLQESQYNACFIGI